MSASLSERIPGDVSPGRLVSFLVGLCSGVSVALAVTLAALPEQPDQIFVPVAPPSSPASNHRGLSA